MSDLVYVNRRVLIIDDQPSVQAAYTASLRPPDAPPAALASLESALFGSSAAPAGGEPVRFELGFASQGEEGCAMLRAAVNAATPYAMAFVDMRMPPGLDGVQTIQRLWEIDPGLQAVICTAYSDYSCEQILQRLGVRHQLLILRKPFEPEEVKLLAIALTEKRHATERWLEHQRELEHTNQQLQQEVTERRRAEAQLLHNALHDHLTDLPNRALLNDRLAQCMHRAQRDADYLFAAIFMDLDDFKLVNDTYGHTVGDHLLTQVGDRLQQCLRGGDTAARPGQDVAARLGGDEFVVLLEGLASREAAIAVAERIRAELTRPYVIADTEMHVGVSMGLAFHETRYKIPEDLLRDADAALYHVKAGNKGRIGVFSDVIREQTMTRLRLGNDLRRAIEDHQLLLLYQPIVSLSTGQVECFEALVRWNHPQLGMISPAEFIPIAEETGFVVELGYWVLREACQQLRLWRQVRPGMADVAVSVNMSPRQLTDPELLDRVDAILQQAGLQPHDLNLEITENAVIQNTEQVMSVIEQIRKRGIGLHLDDFGIGHSSLGCLHQIPFDVVKIDRAFLQHMTTDGRNANVIQAIQTMAHNHRMKVIAEGIECVEQLVQLQTLDCDAGQGYYLSWPVDAKDALALIDRTFTYGLTA